MRDTITLVGLSGSGKTTVGQLVAQALGWQYLDTDQIVEAQAQQTIATIFSEQGEAAFRALERLALQQALATTQAVIATGGGVVEDATNRAALQQQTTTIWLHAPTTALLQRLDGAVDRPLLASGAEAALAQLATRRAAWYAAVADWVVATAALTPQQIADEVVRGYRLHRARSAAERPGELLVTTPGGSYTVRAGANVLAELPERLAALRPPGGRPGRAWLISDTNVLPRYGQRLHDLLGPSGDQPGWIMRDYAIPAGEQYKTLETMRGVYDWLLSNGVERGDVVLALGGGVVGDLVGFVAATVLRGIAVVQLPTTVLAMVDSAIGGKTGVDHTAGKNLIGAFHQPALVLADTSFLRSLPAAERASGWAEAIKHGVIADAALFVALQQHAADVLALTEPITGELLQRAAAPKARVVSGDEREQGGRIMLNYGHTIGHAIEAASDYTLRHGEAVAIGMMAAGTIAQRLGLFTAAELEAQRALLQAFGLPTRIPPAIDQEQILPRIASDKKVRGRRVRWVLPTRIGATVVREDVPEELVREVVEQLRG
jgi:3-dehydroquinate synthase